MKSLSIILACLVIVGVNALGGNLSAPPLEIKGAKVALEKDANRIALNAYVKKMRLGILANEGVHQVSIIKLGFDLPNFAAKGDTLWEARVTTIENEVRAILWINPKTEEVYFVIGPWVNETEAKRKKP